MTDLAEIVARAEDVSFAADWLKELIDEHDAPVFDGTRWTFPATPEGEEQWKS